MWFHHGCLNQQHICTNENPTLCCLKHIIHEDNYKIIKKTKKNLNNTNNNKNINKYSYSGINNCQRACMLHSKANIYSRNRLN